MTYIDFRDGLRHDGAPPVIFHNHDHGPCQIVIPVPPLRTVWMQTTGVPDYEPIRTQQFTIPALHDLYADGTVRRSTGYIPPRYSRTATTPEENTAMPTLPAPTPITTVEEAQAALARFQDVMAREAEQNGHPREFGEWITRAVNEIPGLRAAAAAEFHPQGNMQLTLRITIPNADPNRSRDVVVDEFTREVRRWADADEHARTLTREQRYVAYVLAHPEIIELTDRNTAGYLDTYSVSTRRDRGATNGRVQFVTE